ncbi:MAG: hypothetical protein J6Y85_05130 [Alphaproteobacteria bacterium]|nr:hypothetical protein [Alphaproteobacteria bacterium]
MDAILTDEQRSKIFLDSPEFDQDSCALMQWVKHFCLDYRKSNPNNNSKDMCDALFTNFQRVCPGQSPMSYALHMGQYIQAMALVNEGIVTDFNCIVDSKTATTISSPALHTITLFGINVRNFAAYAGIMDPEIQQTSVNLLNNLLYIYRKLKDGSGLNLGLLAEYYASHPRINIPGVLDIMDECAFTPENERWQNPEHYVTQIEKLAPEHAYQINQKVSGSVRE